MNTLFAERLRSAMQDANLTAAELSRRSGIGTGPLSQYLKGKYAPKQDRMYILAEALDVSPSWLAGLTGNPHNVEISELRNLRLVDKKAYKIPVYAKVSAGLGTTAVDDIVDYFVLYLNSDFEAKETVGLVVSGDSMSPRIEDGDIVQVRLQSSVDSGDIAIILVDGEEGYVKKVVYNEEQIALISLNSAYEPMIFKGVNILRLKILGKVTGVIHQF